MQPHGFWPKFPLLVLSGFHAAQSVLSIPFFATPVEHHDPITELVPVRRHAVERRWDSSNRLEPKDSHNFYWAVHEAANPVARLVVSASEPDRKLLAIEDFLEYTASVNCLENGFEIIFANPDYYRVAAEVWQWLNDVEQNKFSFFMEASNCDHGSRQPHIASNVSFDDDSLMAFFGATQNSWEEATPQYHLSLSSDGVWPAPQQQDVANVDDPFQQGLQEVPRDLGRRNFHLGDLFKGIAKRLGRRSIFDKIGDGIKSVGGDITSAAGDATSAVASVATQAATAITSAGGDVATVATSVASDAVSVATSVAPEITSAVVSVATEATSAVQSVATEAATAVESVATEAATVVESVATEVATAVTSAAGALASILEKPFGSTVNLTHDFSMPILQKTITDPQGRQSTSELDCSPCDITGTVSWKFDLFGNADGVDGGTFEVSADGVGISVGATLNVGGPIDKPIQKSLTLLDVPLGAQVRIPKILELGPHLVVSAIGQINSADNPATFVIGANLEFPPSKFVVDFTDSSKNVNEGWEPKHTKIGPTLDGDVAISMDISPGISFNLEADLSLPGTGDKLIGGGFTIKAPVLHSHFTTHVDDPTNLCKGQEGISANVTMGAEMQVWGGIAGLTGDTSDVTEPNIHTLFQFDFPFMKDCIHAQVNHEDPDAEDTDDEGDCVDGEDTGEEDGTTDAETDESGTAAGDSDAEISSADSPSDGSTADKGQQKADGAASGSSSTIENKGQSLLSGMGGSKNSDSVTRRRRRRRSCQTSDSADTTSADGDSTDTESTDSASAGTGSTDSASTDAASTDSGSTGLDSADSGSTDTGTTDGGTADAGTDSGTVSSEAETSPEVADQTSGSQDVTSENGDDVGSSAGEPTTKAKGSQDLTSADGEDVGSSDVASTPNAKVSQDDHSGNGNDLTSSDGTSNSNAKGSQDALSADENEVGSSTGGATPNAKGS